MTMSISRLTLASWGLTLAVTIVSGGCSKPSAKDPRLLPPAVLVSTAEEATASSRGFTGTVKARVQSELGFRVGGKIIERCVDVGERVKKGQILMRLDPVDLNLSVAAEKANVEAVRARYVQAKADESRFAKLLKADVIAAQDYDRVRAAVDSAKADLDAMEAQSRIRENSSEYAVLQADADGVIVETLSEPGQVVTAGQTVIELAHDGPREAAINLPENIRPATGASATARLYGLDRTYRSELRQLSNAADPVTRTFEARYVLQGEAASAPLGSTVTVEVPVDTSPSAPGVAVPAGAIFDPGSGPGVWTVNERGEVSFRPVKIDSVGRDRVVVSTGIEAGNAVVALGAHLLHEGQVINRIDEAKAPNDKL